MFWSSKEGTFGAFMPTLVLFWLFVHSFRSGFGGSSVVKFGPQMKSVHPKEGLFSELPLYFRHGAAENSDRKAPVLHPTVGILKKWPCSEWP